MKWSLTSLTSLTLLTLLALALGGLSDTLQAQDGDIYLVTPCRLIDTRISGQRVVPGPANDPATAFYVVHPSYTDLGCELPRDVKGLVVNLTVINPPAQGAILLDDYGAGAVDLNNIWSMVYVKGKTRALGPIIVKLDYGRWGWDPKYATTFLWIHTTQPVHLIVDVVGYQR